MSRKDVIGVDVKCVDCGRTKAPIGRSVALGMNYCTEDDCLGYDLPPKAGWLFSGERWSENFRELLPPLPTDAYKEAGC